MLLRTGRKRFLRADDGQALSEYGILLALAAGVQWLDRMARSVGDDPVMLWTAAAVVVLVVGYALKPSR